MTLQEFISATGNSVLIHKYGSANWCCRNGNCGGMAEKIEDIVHTQDCPIRDTIIYSIGETDYPSGEVPKDLKS